MSQIIDSSEIKNFRVCSKMEHFRHASMIGNAKHLPTCCYRKCFCVVFEHSRNSM